MIDKRQLKNAIDTVVHDFGFSRKGSRWLFCAEDVTVILELQKSNYGAVYYLNIGFVLHSLAAAAAPSMESCHVNMRAEELLDTIANANFTLQDLLTFDKPSTDVPLQLSSLQSALRDVLLPLIVQTGTLGGLHSLMTNHTILMKPEARAFVLRAVNVT